VLQICVAFWRGRSRPAIARRVWCHIDVTLVANYREVSPK
jgi:hypothetical protein